MRAPAEYRDSMSRNSIRGEWGNARPAAGTPDGARNPPRAMIVDCAYYRDRARQNDEALTLERARELIATGTGFVWLGMKDPTPDEIGQVTRAFDVPQLAAEGSSQPHQRPRLDEHGDHLFGVVKSRAPVTTPC